MIGVLFLLILGFFIIRTIIIGFAHRSAILSEFRGGNVIVFGRKGKGKDLLFQYVINARKEKCYSNITYGKRSELFDLGNLDCGLNTYENVLDGNIIPFKPPFAENRDFYVSEAGIQLPCQYDHILNKKYPSMPLIYALSRHIYRANVHCNMQGATRMWKLLREQADSFIQVRGRINLFLFFIIRGTIYLNENDAKAERRAIPKPFFRRKKYIEYNYSVGEPRDFWLILPRRKIYYDTRYYKRVFVEGADIPKEKLKRKRIRKSKPTNANQSKLNTQP
ncbi:MAG: hypothetical protein FWD49_07055 [Firmicutes bacterium]|nr:hypothetical protein [Bacillota bacterium]